MITSARVSLVLTEFLRPATVTTTITFQEDILSTPGARSIFLGFGVVGRHCLSCQPTHGCIRTFQTTDHEQQHVDGGGS